MSTSLIRQSPQEMSFSEIQNIGKVFVKSGFFQDTREEAQAVVKIMAGAEMGFSPFASMSGLYIVKGKVSIGANLMAAKIKASGKYDFRVAKGHPTEDECSITFFEKRGAEWVELGVSTFTRKDAQKAGTQNMDKFAKNMLYSRCISNGCKWFCPDVFSTPIYTPEEMGADVDGEGQVINIQPEPKVAAIDPERAEVMAAMQKLYDTGSPKVAFAAWSESKNYDGKSTDDLKAILASWQEAAIKKAQAADPLAAKRDEADELMARLQDGGIPVAHIDKMRKGVALEEATDAQLTAMIVAFKSALNELGESEVQKAVGF